MKGVLQKVALVSASSAITLLLGYSIWLCVDGYQSYKDIKVLRRGWEGRTHQPDAILGFRPIPNARGAETFPIGPTVPMRFDEGGFRVPVDDTGPRPVRPLILFLGCSLTYGAAVPAQETFPYLVGSKLNARAINAGVCSFGYAQMLLRAQELIPTLRPDYVVFQTSPWLLTRAVSQYAPSYYGDIPVPTICVDSQSGAGISIPAPFSTKIFDVPMERFVKSATSVSDFLAFMTRVFVPLRVHDHFGELRTTVLREFTRCDGKGDTATLERYVFDSARETARKNGAKIFFLALNEDLELHKEYFQSHELIDATAALWSRLPEHTRAAYEKAYGIWRGDPPQLVDMHPNRDAHRIIADVVAEAIGVER